MIFSERCPPQPQSPQMFQQSGECEGGGVDSGRGGVLQKTTSEDTRGEQVSKEKPTKLILIHENFFSNNEVPNNSYDDSFNQSLQTALFNLSKTGQKDLMLSPHYGETNRWIRKIF